MGTNLTGLGFSQEEEETPGVQASTEKGHVRTQQEGNCVQGRKRELSRNQPCWPLGLQIPASRTMEKLIYLV